MPLPLNYQHLAGEQIRIFRFRTGKLSRRYDESLAYYTKLDAETVGLDAIDMGRRTAVEKDLLVRCCGSSPDLHSSFATLPAPWFRLLVMAAAVLQNNEEVPPCNAVWDESGHFLLYSTLLGIKVLNVHTNKVVKILGQVGLPLTLCSAMPC